MNQERIADTIKRAMDHIAAAPTGNVPFGRVYDLMADLQQSLDELQPKPGPPPPTE